MDKFVIRSFRNPPITYFIDPNLTLSVKESSNAKIGKEGKESVVVVHSEFGRESWENKQKYIFSSTSTMPYFTATLQNELMKK